MHHSKIFLAVDLGASSGRVMAARLTEGKLHLKEVHRFPTPAAHLPPYYHWDVLAVYLSIVEGLQLAAQKYGERVISIGVDTWGVDYGLLDGQGELLGNPIQYRDARTAEPFAKLPDQLGRERVYRKTGIQFMFFNTLYQLAAEVQTRRPAFAEAQRLLFLPDLFSYWLSGTQTQELTIASTSQLLNPATKTWATELMAEVGIPPKIFSEVVEAGTFAGRLRQELAAQVGLSGVQVVRVPGHDTACAVAATPFRSANSIFLSSGTWSLIGRELTTPDTSVAALNAGFSNELGYGGTVRFLRNLCGMWLIEECRREWARDGEQYSYNAIVEVARGAEARRSLVNPDAPELSSPGNMPEKICEACARTGEPVPRTHAEIIRTAFDSIVMNYRRVVKVMSELGGQPIDCIHLVGGGAHNDFVNQLSADATGLPVEAGPEEATALGNVAVQMIAHGLLSDLASARDAIREAFPPRCFTPQDTDVWAREDARFTRLLNL